jgi:exonuclease III
MKLELLELYMKDNNITIYAASECGTNDEQLKKQFKFSPLAKDYCLISDGNDERSKGTFLLVRREIAHYVQAQYHLKGRCTAIKIKYKQLSLVLAAVYYPANRTDEDCKALTTHIQHLINIEQTSDIILLGDWNATMNPSLDRNNHTSTRPENALLRHLIGKGFTDPYRTQNAGAQQFTWNNQSRIDFFLCKITTPTTKCCSNIIDTGMDSDHLGIKLELEFENIVLKSHQKYNYSRWQVRHDHMTTEFTNNFQSAITNSVFIKNLIKRGQLFPAANYSHLTNQLTFIIRKTAKQHLPIRQVHTTRKRNRIEFSRTKDLKHLLHIKNKRLKGLVPDVTDIATIHAIQLKYNIAYVPPQANQTQELLKFVTSKVTKLRKEEIKDRINKLCKEREPHLMERLKRTITSLFDDGSPPNII